MQQRRTNSYSDVKTQLEIGLEEERQALLEDQKLCRIRTQKLSIETNRRRKALEEKRRDEEEKEQRFREEILQQRKIKLQEATEKFQRAHLPPSQRRRTVYIHKKIPPKLEDALDQIQGSSSSYYLHNHKSRPVDAPSSSANGTWNRKQQPSSMLGADRIHQDRNITQSGSNQCYFQHKLEEAQRLLEEHHISNIQKFHKDAEQLAHSESLSSLDSLEDEADTGKAENGALEEFTSNNLQKALSEVLPYSVNTDAVLSTQPYGNESRQSNTISSFETVDHNIATNKLLQKSKHISNMTGEQIVTFIQNGTATSENKHNYLQDEERKMNKSEQRTALSEHRESATSNLVVKPCKAWATPDPTPREAVQNVVPQENKETIQHLGIYIKPTVSQPLATPTVIPLTEWEGSASTSNDGVHTNSKNSKYPDDIKSVAGTDSMAGANNAEFHLVKNDRPKYAETTNQALRMHENTYINSSMANKVFGINQDQKDQVLKAAVFHDDTNCGHAKQYKKDRNTIGVVEGARLLKSILKKDSKYENAFSKIGFNKTLHFGNKSAPYIRDSVELTKEKEQLFENQKAGNKKLRWLDEIDKIMIEKSVAGSKMNLAGNVFFSEHPDSVNHQGYVFAPKSTLVDQREPPSGTQSSIYSTGYHLAKQAWTPSKGEETSSVGHNQIRNSPPKAKTKLVRRPKSAKTQTTLVHKNRKGIIIRPQSATEASMIIKAQGKLMTPHPPSKPASGFQNRHNAMEGIVPNYTDNANVNISSSIMLPSNQVFTRDTIAKAISYQNLVHPSANLVTAQKYNSNGLGASSKSLLTLNNDQALILQENLQTSSKRHHVYGENGLRLDHTPTDEEIALLWQGVRSALTHKNVAAGDFYPGDLPSNLQPTRPNLSHVVIDGGNLLGGLKTYSRINGLYSAANNGYTTLARRKQILDSTENKRRALLEQRRWKAGPATWTSTQNLHTMKINPFPSAFEPGQTLHGVPNPNEVTESTAQFMLAENLVDTSATDGEILAAMQAMQANKQSFLIHKTQHIGLSALSLEEQKTLQSLDRLNHRLHNVHETIGRTQTIRPPLNIQQFMSQNSDTSVPSQRFRSKSADPRTQLQRRY